MRAKTCTKPQRKDIATLPNQLRFEDSGNFFATTDEEANEVWHWSIAGWTITGLYIGPLLFWLTSWMMGVFHPLWIIPGVVIGSTAMGGIAWMFGNTTGWVRATGIRMVVANSILMMLIGVGLMMLRLVAPLMS